MEVNVKFEQIKRLCEFREVNAKYYNDLAEHIKNQDVFDNDLSDYLNELTSSTSKKYEEKSYLDECKFAAPRWLVYPELSSHSMGWRRGYGEYYALNEPWPTKEFDKLFPKPQNWLFDLRKSNLKKIPVFGFFWRDDGKAKYDKITDDYVEVNDFISLNLEDIEFQYDSFRFPSMELAILNSKYSFFDKCNYPEENYNLVKKGFNLTEDEIKEWNQFKYTVCLNVAYYKIMNNEIIKEKLLNTGDKSLVYYSDDEWGVNSEFKGENLFGFALMELRDEIRRLYQNEDN